MKTILIIHHGWGYGGALIALLRLIDELNDKYHIKVLCIFNSVAVDCLREKNIDVIVPNSFFYRKIYKLFIHSEASYFSIISVAKKFYSFLTYILNYLFFAKRLLSKISYDILYLNSVFLSDWAKAANSPNKTVTHVREPLKLNRSIYTAIIQNFTNKYSKTVIAVSEDNGIRLNGDSHLVVYDPVEECRCSLNIKADLNITYYTYLGGIQRIKGFEQLVRSLPYVNNNVKIFFLGPSEISQSFIVKVVRYFLSPFSRKENALFEKLKKSEHIELIGLTSNIWDYYKISKAVISPFSKAHASLPILEAFSIGKPVIASDVAGTEELIDNDINGYIFKNGDYQALAEKINKLGSLDTAAYHSMSKNALLKYESIKNKSYTINGILQDICNKKKY